MVKTLLVVGLSIVIVTDTASAQVLSGDKPDLYALVIAPIDLTDATRSMTVYDTDEDGSIDKEEQKRIDWKDEIEQFDLNRDGKLTHLELCVRFAKLRGDSGVTQQVVNNANIYLRRNDRNGNGQLDPDEIATMLAKHRRDSGMSKSDLAKVRSVFERYDRNSDGTIDTDEFVAAEGPFSNGSGTNPLSELDKNGDGELTQMEVQQVITQTRKTLGFDDGHLAEARKLLTRHDKNRSTFIDESELFETPVSGQLAKTILKQADQDDDKRVSLIELATYLAKQTK
ncbi:EF-hand domain-containing protein [Stieleria magnilauensis]|uniref:EF hand n=1 Tax=Stieleria magnilauensis TaxID=2527963 RepID=A0ABX5XSQ7_9BACT|nr:EF hand [Planctomycetes bacterium TBK1r]